MNLLVRRSGFLASVQDLGRPGHRASGVSLGGALDPSALRIANLLTGNEEHSAGLETALGTVRLRFADDRVVAWCGGEFNVQLGSAELSAGRSGVVHANEEMQIAAPPNGGRAWIAISGGIDVPAILGSRSTDLRSGFGGCEGRLLRDGDILNLGPESLAGSAMKKRSSGARLSSRLAPNEWARTTPRHPFLRIIPGADRECFASGALHALTHEPFVVTSDSDRMGVRLEGPELRREGGGDLLSEAVAPGTIQVPPSGQPIVLLGDCQTIGGYPKIAHVITVDLAAAAQLRAGDEVRFVETSLEEAQQLLIERERDLATFRIGLKLQAPWS